MGVAILYAAAVRLAWALPVRSGLIAVWPAAGIALGLLLRGGKRLWPGVLLGAFAAKLGHSGLISAVGGAVAPTVEVLLCVALIDRFIRPLMARPALGRFAGIGVLFVGATASGLIGQTALTLADQRYGPFAESVARWALGDVAGMLLFAPLIAAVGREPLPHLRPLRILEDAVVATGLVVACLLIFRTEYGQIWLLIPIGVWLVLRGSKLTVALGSIGLTVVGVYETSAGNGPLAIGGTHDILVAQGFAVLMSTCLYLLSALTDDRRRMLAEHQRLSEEAAALHRVASTVARGAKLVEVAELAGAEVASLLGMDVGAVVAFEDRSDMVRSIGHGTAPGVVPPHLPPFVPIAPGSAIDRLRATGRPERFDERGLAVPSMPPYRQRIAAPIVVEARLWGAMSVSTPRTDDLACDIEDRLGRFAELIGMAIANADAQARLVAQATTDQLTGLVNHRAFHERLREEAAVAHRHGTPLALAVFDLDRFKQVNDTLGHVGGDAVLAETARRMSSAARAGELVARIGGDELALLMPGVEGEDAHAAAERIRRAVAALPFADAGAMTLSAGVCDLTQADDPEELLRLADGALYWAKAHGRDACIRYSPHVVEELSAAERADRLEHARALAALGALARAIDAKDPATIRHSERVAALACELATESGWCAADVARLHDAAVVHDVGKIGVPDAVLSKPSRLTGAEYEIIKRHADLGARIVAEMLDGEQVAWVRGHHERHDGRGYPDGLGGDAIADGARLMALADAWDAMTGARVYSAPMTLGAALDEVRRNDGAQFHPDAVAALERVHARGALGVLTGDATTPAAV
ncbi:diguanylate cyclase domain-containing protein [Baekduia alba]|uniref:diguanylate cyclase domain-containing protein n=1 Tax=Baekduia alba TaxID=2997333 RepID=UPI00233FECD4|nr:diguanylate cyclase [Baekduia alba]